MWIFRAMAALGISRPVMIMAAISSLLIVLAIAKCSYDQAIIDRTKRDITSASDMLDRQTTDDASVTIKPMQDNNRKDANVIDGVTQDAIKKHADLAAQPSGPVTNAVADELRRQQGARTAHPAGHRTR